MSSTTSATSTALPSGRVQVEIPSSTVIAIGLGFFGFSIFILTSLLIARIIRVQRRYNAGRTTGNTLTFRQTWAQEGGLFGFLSGTGGSSLAGGAGAFPDRLAALRRGQEQIWSMLTGEKDPPVMWEVPVKEKGKAWEGLEDDYQPFSLSSSVRPRYVDRAKAPHELPEPILTISLLIALPSENNEAIPARPQRPISEEAEEEWADLPDLVVGTTQVCPMILSQDGVSAGEERQDGIEKAAGQASKNFTKKASQRKDGIVVQELEYQSGTPRRARWEKMEGAKWRIEGLE